MIRPVECWNCNQVIGDDLKGNINILPSTKLAYREKQEIINNNLIAIDRKCPRCKKFNLITNQ